MKENKTAKFIGRKNDHELLKKRAEKLALKVRSDRAEVMLDESACDYVQFSAGGDVFAIETSIVKEVLEPDDIVDVPCTPDFISGVVSLRGHICSVIDLRIFLGLSGDTSKSHSMILFLSSGEIEFGILVDEITDVFSVSKDEIKHLPTSGASSDRYSLGITEGRVVILDGEKLLNDPLLIVNEAISR
ncbi:chemotaxis protein CheW [Maridesulfovibrio frigidus]|uniref:chemotaxis protein CheW n=1 Tax=Maridesulfovibrio frigidus TaxID=340956 RepID=UPI0004E1084D|nr:chemotaxis protein CheW [Maridesulfovibrio frigidus]